MVLTFQIDKIEPSLYRAAVLCGSVEVVEASYHASIADAIRDQAQEVPDGFAGFVNVIYGSASSGTLSLSCLPERASQVADQLVTTMAEIYHANKI